MLYYYFCKISLIPTVYHVSGVPGVSQKSLRTYNQSHEPLPVMMPLGSILSGKPTQKIGRMPPGVASGQINHYTKERSLGTKGWEPNGHQREHTRLQIPL